MDAKKELIERLKKDILFWQGYEPKKLNVTESMGIGDVVTAFPNGVFPTRGIHEFISSTPEQSAASDGFISGLLAVLMKSGTCCVWISTSRKLFPASLRTFNVDPERIIFMDVSKEQDVLWIMEEALKCDGIAAVVAEIHTINLTESRRLQLAVEKNGVTGFILRKDERKAVNNMATARWKITPLPSYSEEKMPGIGFPKWNVELLKVRNGNPGSWELCWMGDRFSAVEDGVDKKMLNYEDQRRIG